MPAFASRYPIKKWAAFAAFGAAAFYLLLSGAEVATQRSFIMIAIVLVGVMVDRPTLTFRTLTVAALARAAAGARGGGRIRASRCRLRRRWRWSQAISTACPG